MISWRWQQLSPLPTPANRDVASVVDVIDDVCVLYVRGSVISLYIRDEFCRSFFYIVLNPIIISQWKQQVEESYREASKKVKCSLMFFPWSTEQVITRGLLNDPSEYFHPRLTDQYCFYFITRFTSSSVIKSIFKYLFNYLCQKC